MDKLIELINEHQKEKHSDGIYLPVVAYRDGIFWSDGDCTSSVMDEIYLISKSYGFIKWLVDNNKIDFSWEGKLSSELVNLFERKLENAEGVIALLSIQDKPIELLISILK